MVNRRGMELPFQTPWQLSFVKYFVINWGTGILFDSILAEAEGPACTTTFINFIIYTFTELFVPGVPGPREKMTNKL